MAKRKQVEQIEARLKAARSRLGQYPGQIDQVKQNAARQVGQLEGQQHADEQEVKFLEGLLAELNAEEPDEQPGADVS